MSIFLNIYNLWSLWSINGIFNAVDIVASLCEIICDADNITKHKCLEGYSQYYIDENTYYFYPMCGM